MTYTVGPLTMGAVFIPNSIENVSDWQTVLDAMECALEDILAEHEKGFEQIKNAVLSITHAVRQETV
jgi:hypothetical protein